MGGSRERNLVVETSRAAEREFVSFGANGEDLNPGLEVSIIEKGP